MGYVNLLNNAIYRQQCSNLVRCDDFLELRMASSFADTSLPLFPPSFLWVESDGFPAALPIRDVKWLPHLPRAAIIPSDAVVRLLRKRAHQFCEFRNPTGFLRHFQSERWSGFRSFPAPLPYFIHNILPTTMLSSDSPSVKVILPTTAASGIGVDCVNAQHYRRSSINCRRIASRYHFLDFLSSLSNIIFYEST
jgi:hypothetical protein